MKGPIGMATFLFNVAKRANIYTQMPSSFGYELS